MTREDSDHPNTVSFTVKELLRDIKIDVRDGFARVEGKIGDVTARIEKLETRVASLEISGKRQASFLAGVSRPLLMLAGVVAWLVPMLIVIFKG